MLTGLLTEITAASEMRPYQTAAKRGRSRDATCLARFGPATAPYLSAEALPGFIAAALLRDVRCVIAFAGAIKGPIAPGNTH